MAAERTRRPVPLPSGAEHGDPGKPEQARQQLRYTADNHMLRAAGVHQWRPSAGRSPQRGGSWTPMRMDTPSSSSSGSRSSQSAPLLPVKPEPQETPLRRRTRGGTLVINEGGRVPSPLSSRLVKPKEPEALLPVEQEHEAMVADLESGLLWLCQDYVREEMERQHRALEEIVARRCGRDEGVVVMLSDNDNEVAAPSQPVRSGDPGQGCSKDAPKDGPPSVNDDDDSGDDYTAFYKLLGMNN